MTITMEVYDKYEDATLVFTHTTAIGFIETHSEAGDMLTILCQDDSGLIDARNYTKNAVSNIIISKIHEGEITHGIK